MKHLPKLAAVLSASLLLPWTGVSASAQATCQCQLPMPLDGSSVGQLLGVQGEVLISQPAGYVPAASGSSLAPGSRVVVGNGAAQLSFGGGCNIALPANSNLTLVPVEGGICVAVEVEAPSPVVEASSGGSGGLIAAGIGAVAIGGVVALAVGSGDDEPASD